MDLGGEAGNARDFLWSTHFQIVPGVNTAYPASNRPLTPISHNFPRTAFGTWKEWLIALAKAGFAWLLADELGRNVQHV
jgi:hypothetical protein